MRALRDFNIPKIVTDDIPVFMGLIGDLFPSIDVPRKRSSDFEKLVRKSALELNLEAEDSYVLKVIEYSSDNIFILSKSINNRFSFCYTNKKKRLFNWKNFWPCVIPYSSLVRQERANHKFGKL